MKKNRVILTMAIMGSLLFFGCSKQDAAVDNLAENQNITANEEEMKENWQGTMGGQNPKEGNGAVLSVEDVQAMDTGDMFSNRDKEVGYDKNADIVIHLSGDTATCESAAVQITGSTVTITEEGTYILSGTLNNGSVVVDAENTDKLQLVLNGVDISCESSAPIYVKQADKVFLTLASNTENKLTTTGEYVAIDDNNIDSVIFSKDDLTLNGSGTLHIEAPFGHGIVAKDDLVVTGGSYVINAKNHGLAGKDSVRIAAGDFVLNTKEDGIHSENDEDITLGFVYIADGNFQIAAGDDGIHAGSQVFIENGNVTISESYEGIEGQSIELAGGNIQMTVSDDGLNAAGGNDQSSMRGGMPDNPFVSDEKAYIRISGGSIYIDASGDGIDSNGAFFVTGGETYVSGPENSGNGSLDYAGQAQITGGVFVAAGARGMAQNFSTTSTQAAMLVNLNATQAAGTSLELADVDGNVLVSSTPTRKYSCVIISSPDIREGNTYTLKAGEESSEIEMSSLIYGSGGMMRGNGGMNGGMQGGRPGGGRDGQKPEGGFNGEPPEGIPEGEF